MKGSRESSRFPAGAAAEGERENSQVKGSASDETLKSGHLPLAAPKRQPRPAGETFRLMTEAQIIVLRLCFFIFGKKFTPDKYRGPVIGSAKPIKGGNYMEKKTPLYEKHLALGGKIVPFAGWLLPVQYSGVIAEHLAVRQAAGLFDTSHMGELVLRGQSALEDLNRLMTNDFRGMEIGQARYSPMCAEDGGTVDDLIVYRLAEETYLIVVNAASTEKDEAWIRGRLRGGSRLENISDGVAQLALQGPRAAEILASLAEALPEKYYSALRGKAAGVDCLISRTGYTGEDGFELYCAPAKAPELWDALLAAGKEAGIIPCGLGARDTLRLEAAMPLYGHELSGGISPYAAGLGMFIKPDKGEFIGREALAGGYSACARRRTGLLMTGRGIAREECLVYDGQRLVGRITSGTHCPYLGKAVAMALIDADQRELGKKLSVDVRGRRVEAEVVKLPFYRRER